MIITFAILDVFHLFDIANLWHYTGIHTGIHTLWHYTGPAEGWRLSHTRRTIGKRSIFGIFKVFLYVHYQLELFGVQENDHILLAN